MLRIVFTVVTLATAQPPGAAEPAVPPPPPPPPLALPVSAEEAVEPATPMLSTSGDAFGESAPTTTFSFRTLTQVRHTATWATENTSHDMTAGDQVEGGAASAKDGDGWRLERVFLRLVARPTPHVSARMLLDFAELMRKNQRRTLKLAYGELKPFKWLEITAGLFKRSFSLLELLPIADYELANVGPTDDFIKELGYGGRDVGAMVRLSPLAKKRYLSLYLGAFAGDPELGYDSSPGKLLTARVESTPWKLPLAYVRLGADLAWRTSASIDRPKETLYSELVALDQGKAVSGDFTFHFLGLELRLEGMYGDRTDYLWRNNAGRPYDPMFDPVPPGKQFLATWGVAAFRFPLNGYWLMPTARVEWLDGDAAHDGEGRLYLTAAVNVDFSESVRLLVDLSRYTVAAGARSLSENRPWPIASRNMKGAYPNFVDYRSIEVDWTQLTIQLQLKI